MDIEMHPALATIIIVVRWATRLALGAWVVIGALLAFAGGYLLLPWPWYVSGGFLDGFLWLVGSAIAAGILFQIIGWIMAALVTPFQMAYERRQSRQ